uniref:Uncharacterized protein n=1 Tax=Anguilla anguilla TaxID=7936 RepID=A0A0E9S0Q5_ANGAN
MLHIFLGSGERVYGLICLLNSQSVSLRGVHMFIYSGQAGISLQITNP